MSHGSVIDRRHQYLERLYRAMARRAGTGPVDLVELLARWKRWLDRHPRLNGDSETVSRADVLWLDKRHRPRYDPAQLTLFDPEAWLVVGEGLRVEMGRAGQLDCIAAMQVRAQSHLVEATDFVRDIGYWQSRIAAFTPADADLEAVERRVFGWTG